VPALPAPHRLSPALSRGPFAQRPFLKRQTPEGQSNANWPARPMITKQQLGCRSRAQICHWPPKRPIRFNSICCLPAPLCHPLSLRLSVCPSVCSSVCVASRRQRDVFMCPNRRHSSQCVSNLELRTAKWSLQTVYCVYFPCLYTLCALSSHTLLHIFRRSRQTAHHPAGPKERPHRLNRRQTWH